MSLKDNMPQHVVAIPDGNRRWAKKRHLNPWLGHRAGVKTAEKIFLTVRDLNLRCFSFWGMSKDNFQKRPSREVKYLLEIFRVMFAKLKKEKDLYRLKIKVNIFGAWPQIFPERIKKPMIEVIEATKKHDQRHLNFLIAYDGKDEILSAIKSIISQSKKKKDLKITQDLVKANLWTKDLPSVDLIIRTGVENDPHLSGGLLMWDSGNAQLYFTSLCWPDFGPDEFKKAIKDFQQRERRFGK